MHHGLASASLRRWAWPGEPVPPECCSASPLLSVVIIRLLRAPTDIFAEMVAEFVVRQGR